MKKEWPTIAKSLVSKKPYKHLPAWLFVDGVYQFYLLKIPNGEAGCLTASAKLLELVVRPLPFHCTTLAMSCPAP